MQNNPWFRCECGKIHVVTYLWMDSKCSCGRLLKPQLTQALTTNDKE